jgi:hypothetical protein
VTSGLTRKSYIQENNFARRRQLMCVPTDVRIDSDERCCRCWYVGSCETDGFSSGDHLAFSREFKGEQNSRSWSAVRRFGKIMSDCLFSCFFCEKASCDKTTFALHFHLSPKLPSKLHTQSMIRSHAKATQYHSQATPNHEEDNAFSKRRRPTLMLIGQR